jgi:ribosomal protein L11 methyltransferase
VNSKRTTLSTVTSFARVRLDEDTAKRALALLSEQLDDISVAAFENDDGQWQLELHTAEAFDEAALRRLVKDVAGDGAGRALAFGAIAARDWVAESLAGLQPVSAGRFLIHGSHDRARASQQAIPIEIEAALAFGTGHHGTTRGCLLALDWLIRRERPRHVLDVGTGTGVLAIAAAKALHCSVVASDIDKVAVETARDNARLNHVAAPIVFVHARGVATHRLRSGAPYDLVLANILLPPLKLLAAPMTRLLSPRAHVILSGLLPEHANAARAIYAAQGLALVRQSVLDNWATLVLRRGG